MENALPTTQSTSTMLAPEEMFAPASKNDLVARSELDPSQKKRMRQKDRKTRMRQRQALDSAVDKFAGKSGGGGKARGGVKSQKDRALKELVKTGKGVSAKFRADRPAFRLLTSLSRLGHRRREGFGQEASRQRSAQRIRLSELDAQAVVVDSTSYTTYRVSSGCMYSFDRLYEQFTTRPVSLVLYMVSNTIADIVHPD